MTASGGSSSEIPIHSFVKLLLNARFHSALVCVFTALLVGCATDGGNGSNASGYSARGPVVKPFGPPLPEGVVLRQDKDIQGVWLAESFNFRGYDGLIVQETVFAAKERPNETTMRAMARRVVREQMIGSLQNTSLFASVSAADGAPANARVLTMSNTIIEYEKGGGGARYFVGLYGGGQPVVRVRGEIRDGDKLVCVYEMRRSGESAGSRFSGAFMSDEEIQRNDIRDLASDFADFIKRAAGTGK